MTTIMTITTTMMTTCLFGWSCWFVFYCHLFLGWSCWFAWFVLFAVICCCFSYCLLLWFVGLVCVVVVVVVVVVGLLLLLLLFVGWSCWFVWFLFFCRFLASVQPRVVRFAIRARRETDSV